MRTAYFSVLRELLEVKWRVSTSSSTRTFWRRPGVEAHLYVVLFWFEAVYGAIVFSMHVALNNYTAAVQRHGEPVSEALVIDADEMQQGGSRIPHEKPRATLPSLASFCFTLLMRCSAVLVLVMAVLVHGQEPTYVNTLPAEPPYYRVRHEGSTTLGNLVFAVSYTMWIPPGVKMLRGIVVHQHGCGEGSCKSGQTGSFDLHWQALAKKHDCALISPVYEQPEKADCALWCDPRNGSDQVFRKSLSELGVLSGHMELSTVPWALWGHSGGGVWAGAMTLLHPERVIASWLRSGVPPIKAVDGKPAPLSISDAALQVPVMCNLGTKEGVTVREGQFAKVWSGVESFFLELRGKGGLAAVSVDPHSSHDCGNQRYLAIPWFDICLTARLPNQPGEPLKPMPKADTWIAALDVSEPSGSIPVPAAQFSGDLKRAVWLPNAAMARAWAQYIKDTAVPDNTPPPAPFNLYVSGNELSWEAEADLQSGLASFIIERDGAVVLATVPDQGKNPFGRPIFQNLSYSDTPTQPLVQMRFTDKTPDAGKRHRYRVIAVNTVGLRSDSPSKHNVSVPVRRPVLESWFGTTPAIDGVVAPGEWEDATEIRGVADWTAEFSDVNDAADLALRGWVKHDAERLYFAFEITDDLLYGIDTERWLPKENAKAHELSHEGYPWFGDEMEILLNASNTWKGDEDVEGSGGSWQMVCNLTKSRLGGIGKGGLIEGEPRTSEKAWKTYQRWIREGTQRAEARPKPGGHGYVIEWAVQFNPCLETGPGMYYSPKLGITEVGLNVALGDLDTREKGVGNFGDFHHEQWWAGARHTRTHKNNFGTLRLMGNETKK